MTDRALAGLVIFCILAPVSLVGYALLARFVLHGPVTPESLARSVAVESPDLARGTCRRARPPGTWRCRMNDGATSGARSTTLVVRVRPGSSCWEARGLEGCVRRWEDPLF